MHRRLRVFLFLVVLVGLTGPAAAERDAVTLSVAPGGAPGVDTYVEQVTDMASAYASLQNDSGMYGLDVTRMYVGGHSAGGHLSHELNLRWTEFEQTCSNPSGCAPAAGAIGFEGIYDIASTDGTCASGQHNDPLAQVALAICIVNFVASGGAGI